LSGTTAGAFTATKTLAPTHLVYVGIVVRSNSTEGAIEVAVQNGYELEELHDVSIGTLANNDLLAYESSTSLWKNKTYSALGLLTSADAAATYAPIASPSFTGLATFNNPGNYAITLDNASGFYTSISSGVYSIFNSGTEVIRLSNGGIKYPDGVTQTVAYPGPSGFLLKSDNLSGLANTSTARTNLGLGTMATATASDYSTTTVANGLYYPLSSNPAGYLTTAPVTSVAGRTGAVTLAVADVSGAAPLASPTFTGVPAAPTATAGTSTTQLATTAFVTTGLNLKANIASPSLTGTPLSTTAAADTNTTQIATTAFVVGQASSTTPAATGTAAVGTSLRYARADHVHANPLPTGGTTGQVLSKVDGTNYNTTWVTPSGGGGGTDYQAFTTSGTHTWTKPAGAKWVEVLMIGGGGGGASGARQATTVARSGGGGGTCGGYVILRIDASYLGATQSVVVGEGGAGGSARTTDNSVAVSGSAGGDTTFFGFKAGGGRPGASASQATPITGFAYGASGLGGSAAGAGTTTTGQSGVTQSNPVSQFASTGAGGGAGAAANITTSAAGGSGGAKTSAGSTASGFISTVAGGAGGTTGGTAPTQGVSLEVNSFMPTGSGGGAYRTAQAGMNGANGASYGGAGGGGSASDNGFPSGAGGTGGTGAVYIITYC
jgi:hypothetical protein